MKIWLFSWGCVMPKDRRMRLSELSILMNLTTLLVLIRSLVFGTCYVDSFIDSFNECMSCFVGKVVMPDGLLISNVDQSAADNEILKLETGRSDFEWYNIHILISY